MARRTVFVAALALGALTLALAACGGGDEGTADDVTTVEETTTGGEDEQGGPEWIPQPPAGKAAIGGTFTIRGRPARKYDVSLGKKGKNPDFASTKTDARGRFVFRAIRPGAYYMMPSPFFLHRKTLPRRARVRCSMPGFKVSGTPIPNPKGLLEGLVFDGQSRIFKLKPGDRVTKNIVFTFKAQGRPAENVDFSC